MNHFTFVLNPAAGKGLGRRLRPKLQREIGVHLSKFDIIETAGPGDATRIANQCDSEIVVAIGGDGTVHEVANGIVGSSKRLGVIPIGSGNDFVKSAGIPTRMPEAVAFCVRGAPVLVDVGTIKVSNHPDGSSGNVAQKYFVNGVGVGFDAMVADRTKSISWATGTILYIVAVLQTLRRYDSPEYTIRVDGGSYRQRSLLVAIGNGKCAGGGFYLTPRAEIADGVLDVCLIKDLPVSKILALMPRVMTKSHTGMDTVKMDRTKRLELTADSGVSVHADGEVLGNDVRVVDIGIRPRALGLIARPA